MTTPTAQTLLELADELYNRIAPQRFAVENLVSKDLCERIIACLRASQPAAQAPEPVAWRWRPRGATNWIYNPEASWLAAHHNEHTIEYEPLFTQAPAGTGGDVDWNIRKFIDFLRADEGDSVTLLCDNPDFNGQPNCAVECNGYWTSWHDKRFTGDTLEAALELAYFECRQWRENPPADVSPDPLSPPQVPDAVREDQR